MRPKPDQPLAIKTLKVWKIVTAMSSLLLCVFPGAYWGARMIWDLPMWPFYFIVAFILLVAIITIFIIQKLQWSRWK